jgi:predicted  nucleic acid-binding Zn-ribbon protein
MTMSYICTECGKIAEEDDIGQPLRRECIYGGDCQFVRDDEFREMKRQAARDAELEDDRLFKGE